MLGHVDGFGDDEAESESDERAEVPVRLLTAERDALEALELADKLLDPGAGPIECLRKESRSAPGCRLVRDRRTDAALTRRRAGALAIIAFVPESRARRDVRAKIEQDFELGAVARLAACQMEGKRQAIEFGFEMDLGREASARAAQGLIVLPPFGPRGRDGSQPQREGDHLDQMR